MSEHGATPSDVRIGLMPTTADGRRAVALGLGFVGLFGLWLAYVVSTPIARPTFFSDPVHATLLLAAVASAAAGAVVGVRAAWRDRERSVATALSVLLGVGVVLWMAAELGGH